MLPKKGKTRCVSRRLPAPRWSDRLYVRIEPDKVGMFRFLLEAEDNLGYMSVVDRWAAVLQVVFSPHQEQAVRRHMRAMQSLVPFTVLPFPRTAGAGRYDV